MLGILQGLKVTIKHFFSPKLTRFYPYEKPKLPERSRGLIQLITEPETGVLKCESCLLCEKTCPPRAITISYEKRGGFRSRPTYRPNSRAAYIRPRLVEAVPYAGPRPISPAALTLGDRSDLDLASVDRLVTSESDPVLALVAVQQEYGYLPKVALRRISELMQVPFSDLVSAASLSPGFRFSPPEGLGPGVAETGDASALVMPGAAAFGAIAKARAAGGDVAYE